MKFILDLTYLLTAVAISPMVLYRMIAHGRYKKGWTQKFGRIVRRDMNKKCIWIHAVSVGEVNATKTIISQLREKFPDHEIVMSTTTDTGFARASELFAEDLAIFYFPFDFSLVMKKAFARIKPSLCLLMELEVWPNFISTAKEFNVPVVVANGRISERSFSRYKLIKPIAEKIFRDITLILPQTQEYADRFAKVGCPGDRIVVTGSLKYDTAQICEEIEGADEVAKQLNIESKKLLVAGGTGNDEETIILEVFRNLLSHGEFADLRLVIVPRKPERFNEVAQAIKQLGFGCIRFSKFKSSGPAPSADNQTVILGDTMGDLRKFYSLAEIIFVGRSLVPMGGSDMMEAAALGKCTVFGPHAFNFKQTVDALLGGDGAVMVKDKDELLETILKCLNEPNYAKQIARNGQQIIKDNQGATSRTIEEIAKLLAL